MRRVIYRFSPSDRIVVSAGWLVLVLSLALAGCSGNATAEPAAAEHADEGDHHGDHGDQHDEDMHAMDDGHMMEGDMGHEHVDVPADFAGRKNPLPQNEATLSAGQRLFVANCLTCHGEAGHGDGPAAVALDPRPADLGDAMMMGMTGDDYLFWRVSKGGIGDPFNSAMPPWDTLLTEEEIWQVISYIRTLSQ